MHSTTPLYEQETDLLTPQFLTPKQGEFSISLSDMKPLSKFMVTQGVPLEPLLKGTGINFVDFTKLDKPLEFKQYLKLISNARELAKRPDYALMLGEQFFINHDGALDCRVMSSEYTQAAMELLVEYQSLFMSFLDLSLDITDDYGVFSLEEKVPLGDALPHFVEYCFAILYSLGNFCHGQKKLDLEFEFSYDKPKSNGEFERFFDSTLRFNCSANRVILPRKILKQSLVFSDTKSALVNDQLCRQHIGKKDSDDNFILKVKTCMRSISFIDVSVETLADKLCMSPRSLRRHLNNQGVSYKILLENERKRIAIKRIEKHDISIEELAQHLGYQNSSSFSRAFKRWFGMSPNHYLAANESNR